MTDTNTTYKTLHKTVRLYTDMSVGLCFNPAHINSPKGWTVKSIHEWADLFRLSPKQFATRVHDGWPASRMHLRPHQEWVWLIERDGLCIQAAGEQQGDHESGEPQGERSEHREHREPGECSEHREHREHREPGERSEHREHREPGERSEHREHREPGERSEHREHREHSECHTLAEWAGIAGVQLQTIRFRINRLRQKLDAEERPPTPAELASLVEPNRHTQLGLPTRKIRSLEELEIDGVSATPVQHCARVGVSLSTIRSRMRRYGLTFEQALLLPKGMKGHRRPRSDKGKPCPARSPARWKA
jgi:hypothetical protein